jgi:hypothetical protein
MSVSRRVRRSFGKQLTFFGAAVRSDGTKRIRQRATDDGYVAGLLRNHSTVRSSPSRSSTRALQPVAAASFAADA